MAKSEKILNDNLRNGWVERFVAFLKAEGEDVQLTASNTLMFPTLDEDGNDKFVTLTVKVPKGSRDGDAYDGYAEAEDYAKHLKEQAEKKAEAEAKKSAKIARDKAAREAKAKAKAEREAKGE